MSDSIWDGTEFDPSEDITAALHDLVHETDDRNARIVEFNNRVRDMSGPLGALLRQIAHAHAEFQSAVSFGGTTAGEETRLYGVLDEAMSTLDWLREGTS